MFIITYQEVIRQTCIGTQKQWEEIVQELQNMQKNYRTIMKESSTFLSTLDSILIIKATEYINHQLRQHPKTEQIDYLIDKSLILYMKSPSLDLTDFFLEKLKEQPFEFDKTTQEYIDQLFQPIKESKLRLKD